ncbi:MAG TPA: S8 family serine peptidase, partial [Actinomycetota bacterium]|nr:S8 family serine peptidase [Actinomycetota bacterium]
WGGDNWFLEADRAPQAWNLLEAIKAKRPRVEVVVLDDPADTSNDLNHVFLEQLCTSTGVCSDATVDAGDNHGTHVAGTIAGTFDNGIGPQGINPIVRVRSVGSKFGSGSPGTVAGYSERLQLWYLILLQKLNGNWPDLRVINYSAGFPPVSLEKLQQRHPGAGADCGPGPNDDGPGSSDPCSMNNDDKWLTDFFQIGQVAAAIAQVAADSSVIIVQAAGNESNDYCAPLSADPDAKPPCTSAQVAGALEQVSAEHSGEFIWASKNWASSSDNPVIAVEAVGDNTTTPDSPSAGRATFSNPGGDISAPGAHIVSNDNGGAYRSMRGTSMASPQVTGAIAYLLAYDPTLTILQVRHALVTWANGDTTGGASPRLDLFASLMSLPGAAKQLVDVNDRSVDGNARTRLDLDGPHDIAPLPIQGDREIDMKDFRAFRDAWLASCQLPPALGSDPACPASGDIALDGEPDHKKRDLNLDGCVRKHSLGLPDPQPDCPTAESVFSRFDFNGDAVVRRFKASEMPFDHNGAIGTTTPLTDLEVLASQWTSDPERAEGWTVGNLDELMPSGDLEIHADDLFDAGARDVEVKMTASGGPAIPTRHIKASLQREKSYIVASVPTTSGPIELEASATVGGETIEASPLKVEVKLGKDKRIDLCKGLTVTATPAELAADGKQKSTIVAQLNKCSDVEVASRSIAWAVDNAAGGSLSQTDAATDADGKAKATFTVGTTPGTYKVKAIVTLDQGVTETAEAKIEVGPPLTIKYVWQQHIVDWTQSGTTKWSDAPPGMPDCTVPGVVDYCIDEFNLTLLSEENGGIKREGSLDGGGSEFTVTQTPSNHVIKSKKDWELTLTNGTTHTGGATSTFAIGPGTPVANKPLKSVNARFGSDGVHVAGMQEVGDLNYGYTGSYSRTGTGPDPFELHGMLANLLLVPQPGGQHIRFAAKPDEEIVFPLDEATSTYLPFQSCGKLDQDLQTEHGYYVEDPSIPGLPATVLGRTPIYTPGARPMPVGPGHLLVTYAFGAVVQIGNDVLTPALPDCTVNNPPTGKFDAPETTLEGRPTQFVDRSTDIENDIESWQWNFGDGEPASTEQSPYHTFPDNGTYTVTLTVK